MDAYCLSKTYTILLTLATGVSSSDDDSSEELSGFFAAVFFGTGAFVDAVFVTALNGIYITFHVTTNFNS